jgi:hypothetical protein
VTKFNLSHARHDPAHCLCPGLFRSFKKGTRKKTPLDVTYNYGDERIEVSGPELLGAFELRLLQGLVALSGPKGVVLHINEPKTEAGRALAKLMEPRYSTIDDDALVVRGSYYELAKEIGMPFAGGSDIKQIQEGIERLWKVSMISQDNQGKRRGHRILSEYESNANFGHLFISLNPRIAAAVLGDARHIRINMDEVRALKTDPARLLHQRLSGFIDEGKAHPTPLTMETLEGYIWHDATATKGSSTERMRWAKVKDALGELSSLGWTITETSKHLFVVKRASKIGEIKEI